MKCALIIAVAILGVVTGAVAKDYKIGSLEIADPWARATPKGAQIGAGYMTIKNGGTTTDRLVGGSLETANGFQFHEMTMEQGVAKMRELKDIEIKPGQMIEFKPGGSHVMFENLKRPLNKGEHIKGTLIFERAGTVQIEYEVAGIGVQSSPQATEHMRH